MNAKKLQMTAVITVIMMFVGFTAFAASKQRTAIDKFLKSYEDVVVKAEKAAKSNKASDLMSLQMEILEFAEQADEIQSYDEWTMDDSMKYLDLTNRYTAAVSKLSGGTGTSTYGYSF